jgi:hypothetical protein
VVFAAIAGIPPDINLDANEDNDISSTERDNYYDQILNHPLMQETVNPDMKNLNYVCQHETGPGSSVFDTQAVPARRLTEVAKGFGANGIIRSICAETFTPAMSDIIDVLSNNIGGVCLPNAYTRDSNGLIECDVTWTMPPDLSCDDYIYLEHPPLDRPQYDDQGRERCIVNQVPVINSNTSDPAEALDSSQNIGLGWYYDDFSEDMQRVCKITETVTTKQRMSFTLTPGMNGQNEDPPGNVKIELECLQQFATWSNNQNEQNESSESSDALSPEQLDLLGMPCLDEFSDNCPLPPVEAGEIFCNQSSDECVLRCRDNGDCPADWLCDGQKKADSTYINQTSYPICVNPICNLPEGEARNCGNTDVGEACTPMYVPSNGFNRNEIYIETNSPACETRICGVFRVEGNPREKSQYFTNEEYTDYVQDHIFCTCRCSSSDPDVSTCTCPDDFECSESLLSAGGSALAGGYCVRKGLLDVNYESP